MGSEAGEVLASIEAHRSCRGEPACEALIIIHSNSFAHIVVLLCTPHLQGTASLQTCGSRHSHLPSLIRAMNGLLGRQRAKRYSSVRQLDWAAGRCALDEAVGDGGVAASVAAGVMGVVPGVGDREGR